MIGEGAGRLEDASGQGTYSGYFTAEDKFHVDWEGQTAKLKNDRKSELSANLRTVRTLSLTVRAFRRQVGNL